MEKLRPAASGWAKLVFWMMMGILYFPFIYLMFGSFIERTTTGETFFSFHWYQLIFADSVFKEAIQRSLILAIGNGLISMMIGATAATALFRSEFKHKKILSTLSLVSLVMPELVFALSLLSWFFILKFELSLLTVLLAQVTFSISFVVFTVGARLSSLDLSVEEAAKDLGAGDWEIFFKVTLPQLKPALATSFILGFLLSFDDFVITYFMSGVGSDTLPIKLYTSMKMGHTPKLNALSSLMIVFSMGLIFVLSRLKGLTSLTSGANKKN